MSTIRPVYFLDGPIPTDKVSEILGKQTKAGAHELFLGRVRPDEREMGSVLAIHYSCYKEMATKKLKQLVEETQIEFPVLAVEVLHSLGRVEAGDLCLLVAVDAQHRLPAREACTRLVERIKKELPVWGEEILDNQHREWKENT